MKPKLLVALLASTLLYGGTAGADASNAAESSASPTKAQTAQEAASEPLVQALRPMSRGEIRVQRREERRAARQLLHEQEAEGEGQEEPPEEEAPEEEPPSSKMIVGVDSGGWTGSSTFSDLASGGVHYVRTTSSAAGKVEPEGLAAGVHIATLIFGTGGAISAINPSTYASEVKSYFAKYGLQGGLAVEVLNEPGNNVFWSDPTDYAVYAKLVKAVHEALAALPAGSRPAEICSWDGGEASPNANKPWGQGIKSAGALPYCDGVTVHPYGGKAGADGGALGGRKDVELAHSESGKPVYITEIGWPTAVGQSPTGDSQQWTEAQQAANITGFMQWASSTGYVPMTIYFNYVDYGTNDYYGIETAARKHKLGFAALAEASTRW